MLKMIATNDFLTAAECTEFVFAWGCAPDIAGGAYSAPPDTLAGLTGAGRKGAWKEGGEGGVRNCVDPRPFVFSAYTTKPVYRMPALFVWQIIICALG